MTVAEVQPEEIEIDPGLQPRVALNESTIAEYVEDMIGGAAFPPVVAFNDGARLLLADGFHRHAAAARAKVELRVDIRSGSRRDALIFALSANATHGLKRTNADKRRCVELALEDEEIRGWSDRRIAETCGVSDPFVGGVRRQLQTVCSSSEPAVPLRVGADGKARALPAPRRAAEAPTERKALPAPREDVIEAEAVVVASPPAPLPPPAFDLLPMSEIDRLRRKKNTKEITERVNGIVVGARRLSRAIERGNWLDDGDVANMGLEIVMEVAAFGPTPEKADQAITDLGKVLRSLTRLLPFITAQHEYLRQQQRAAAVSQRESRKDGRQSTETFDG